MTETATKTTFDPKDRERCITLMYEENVRLRNENHSLKAENAKLRDVIVMKVLERGVK